VYKIRLCTLWVTTQLDLSWVRTHPADPLGRPGLPDSQVWLTSSRFFEHYHHFHPFLDPAKSPDDYYKSGNSLFWAIIGVASRGSRRYREDITLLHALSYRVMKHIWAEIPNPPYKVSTLQSLIILCIWPFPTTTYKSVSVTFELHCYKPFNAVGLVHAF
jgi:hypothetical protein